jgi:hypothetical protein
MLLLQLLLLLQLFQLELLQLEVVSFGLGDLEGLFGILVMQF